MKRNTERKEAALRLWHCALTVDLVRRRRGKKARRRCADRRTRALALLPDAYRHVLLLADVERLGLPAVAGLLALSLPQVRRRLQRARLLFEDAQERSWRHR